MIRSCVTPASTPEQGVSYSIYDLGDIVSIDSVPENFNVSLLQRSQIQWLFFLARHYCDKIED